MNTSSLKNSARLLLAGLMAAFSVAASRADVPFYIQTFDNVGSFQNNGSSNYNPPPISVVWEFGNTVSHSVAWSSKDAGGNANSGSVQFSWTWDATETNGASADFRFDLFTYAGTVTNASLLSFDMMIDPSSTPGLAGDYGFMNVITRDNNYVWYPVTSFGEGLLTAVGGTTGVWSHVSIPLSALTTNNFIRALTIQDYNDGSRQIIGSETIYIDNLTISTPGALVSPTQAISKVVAPRGLHLATTHNATLDSGNPEFERQGLETFNAGGYSWVGEGLTPFSPVTYSVTITNYPSATYSNFEAHILLVPSYPSIPTEINPDYQDPNVIRFLIQNQSDGTAAAQFTYKIGAPTSSTYTSLVTVTNPSPLGTWSLTLNNDSVLVTTPSGNTATTNLPSGTATGTFVNPLAVYVGAQADVTNNMGQEAVLSHFQIVSNSIVVFDDTFTTASVDLTKWTIRAEDPVGVFQIPSDAALALSWTLPDAGFRLTASSSLTTAHPWPEVALPKVLVNGRRTVYLPSSYLNTNRFYLLQNP